jgi:hypothetical protein
MLLLLLIGTVAAHLEHKGRELEVLRSVLIVALDGRLSSEDLLELFNQATV